MVEHLTKSNLSTVGHCFALSILTCNPEVCITIRLCVCTLTPVTLPYEYSHPPVL